MNRLLTATALLGTSALVQAVSNVASGSAIVINQCSYPVYIHDVPAANEGSEEIDPEPLQPGQSWSQQWTGLTAASGAHDGWSIKLTKTPELISGQIMQYEYTYQPTVNADNVWLDMSEVNGLDNPWNEDGWTIASSEPCSKPLVQHLSYQYSTDDSAMQPVCPASSDFTVTLCAFPGGLASWGGSEVSSIISAISSAWSPPSSTYVASPSTTAPTSTTPTSTVAPSTTAAPVPTSTPMTTAAPASTAVAPQGPPAHGGPGNNGADFVGGAGPLAFGDKVAVNDAPTTFATSATPKYVTYGHTVTEIETAWITSFTTVDFPEPTEEVHKRHAHHAAHHHA